MTLTVTARGGTGPLTYAYAGLSSGCSSANVSSLTCTPTATGTFTVTVTVTDAVGKSATATVDLIVNPPFVSTVSCGHDLSCSVQSSAALSNVKFAGNTIHFTATGPAGTQGYANVTVPKAAIPNINGQPAKIMYVSGDVVREIGYVMDHGIKPNGGGTRVNQYTLILDVMVGATGPGAASIRSSAYTRRPAPSRARSLPSMRSRSRASRGRRPTPSCSGRWPARAPCRSAAMPIAGRSGPKGFRSMPTFAASKPGSRLLPGRWVLREATPSRLPTHPSRSRRRAPIQSG